MVDIIGFNNSLIILSEFCSIERLLFPIAYVRFLIYIYFQVRYIALHTASSLVIVNGITLCLLVLGILVVFFKMFRWHQLLSLNCVRHPRLELDSRGVNILLPWKLG
jgi:hypothetical protein